MVNAAQAQLRHGLWDLTRSGIQPMSPPLIGRFFTHRVTRKAPHPTPLTFDSPLSGPTLQVMVKARQSSQTAALLRTQKNSVYPLFLP